MTQTIERQAGGLYVQTPEQSLGKSLKCVQLQFC
jgi:hypothetical protein